MVKKDVPELRSWFYDPVFRIYWGFIYNDTKGRFVDGTWIHTSDIPALRHRNRKRAGYIKTLNTTYYLTPKKDW